MIVRRANSRGVAILSMLLCLVIIFILVGMFYGPAQPGPGGAPGSGKPWALSLPDRTRDVVCDANRRTMQTTVILDEEAFGAAKADEPSRMMETAKKFAKCPGEGSLYLCDKDIYCTEHDHTQSFRERLNLM